MWHICNKEGFCFLGGGGAFLRIYCSGTNKVSDCLTRCCQGCLSLWLRSQHGRCRWLGSGWCHELSCSWWPHGRGCPRNASLETNTILDHEAEAGKHVKSGSSKQKKKTFVPPTVENMTKWRTQGKFLRFPAYILRIKGTISIITVNALSFNENINYRFVIIFMILFSRQVVQTLQRETASTVHMYWQKAAVVVKAGVGGRGRWGGHIKSRSSKGKQQSPQTKKFVGSLKKAKGKSS